MRAASAKATASPAEAPSARRRGRSLLLIVGIVFAVAAGWFTWRQVTSQGTTREGAPNWSPDGKRIVFYAERRGGPADLWVMDVDDRERQQLTSTPADEGGPTFSPNGRQIAFDTNRDGNFEIYVMDVDTRAARRLTQHKGRDVAPAWSRDGRRIAFMSDRQGRKEFDIYVMNADGTGVEALTKSESNWFPQYGPDGRSLAMHVWNDVHVFDLPTRTARRLTFEPQNGMYPTWSRYGEQIAFMTWRNGPPQIFTMNADGTNQEMLVTMSRGGAIDPRWSPDGTRIAFVHVPEASVHEQPNAEQARLIYVVDIETRKLTRLSR